MEYVLSVSRVLLGCIEVKALRAPYSAVNVVVIQKAETSVHVKIASQTDTTKLLVISDS